MASVSSVVSSEDPVTEAKAKAAGIKSAKADKSIFKTS